MLNKLLEEEDLDRIAFALMLNQMGFTGVDVEKLFKKYLEDNNMEDIPMNIRELEETKIKNEPTERLAEPDYYAGNGLSPLEAFKKGLLSREETIGFIKGNVIKYTVRAGHKENASKDIVKAIDYLTHLKRLYEHEQSHHIKPNIEAVNLTNGTTKQAKELVHKAFEGLEKIG